MRVLVACERSGVVRRAFRALGHNAWSCDLEPPDDGSEFHIQGDALAVAYQGQRSYFEVTANIQPWQFGHGETKATCLWLKNLPPLTPTNIVSGREQRVFRMAPGPDRKRDRSRTFEGIASAMADQWGALQPQRIAA